MPKRDPKTPPPPAERIPWGWLEFTVIIQYALPLLLYVPGTRPIRFVLRLASFGIPLLAWIAYTMRGKRAPGRPFPAQPWLLCALGWLGLMILNPLTDGPIGGIATVGFYFAIMSPAFWAPAEAPSPAHIQRLLAVLLICNFASVCMGVLQFYRPGQFDPPGIEERYKNKEGVFESLTYKRADGQVVLRPCGLSDNPGGAAIAGTFTSIIALSFALLPLPSWKRLALVIMSLAGVGIIYLCQVRAALVLVIISQLAAASLLVFRRDFKRLTQLGTIVTIVAFGSLAWVARDGGDAVLKRFNLLFDDPLTTYAQSRGGFLQSAFTNLLWEYPLGGGLARWGMMGAYFGGNKPAYWAEIQFSGWILDGGILLPFLYMGAILTALYSTARIALRAQDPRLWSSALVLGSIGASLLINCISYTPFHSYNGMLLWLGLGALHGANEQARRTARIAALTAAAQARPRTNPLPASFPTGSSPR